MTHFTDQQYLLSQQYKDAANLNARVELHKRFSTNKYGWNRWVFDQLNLAPGEHVLELGCGPGHLWAGNIERLPTSCHLTLTDFSPGMIQEAHAKLAALDGTRFKVVDVQDIPYGDGDFDVVVANHMLYHVPDRTRALSEIRRVLKQQGGRFYASTLGRTHMQELAQLVNRFDPSLTFMSSSQTERFSLESGGEQLAQHFASVTMRRYEDALVVTEAAPLIAYVLSSFSGRSLAGDRLPTFTQFVQQELAAHDAIRITKDSGIFICGVSE